MLKSEHRLRRSRDFTRTVRRGSAARAASVVVHAAVTEDSSPAKVGFVVGRAVGGAVVRNTVRRRLRHQMASRMDQIPHGSTVVVRALPGAAGLSSESMGADLQRALSSAFNRARSR
ncbi:ribonuclease P protein component [Phytoactinopolyspora mesophila]|uniref:Ribonuclease P protein component n=1 Tax=Phytoactinopolyspora mesophila TaxID=2650750 RepID=A0A7K3M3K0_9ACTN|nr:ribonuclease P protein component [Phytoactinopolyspora mesophila]